MKIIYMYEKRIPIAIDIMEIMKHTYINKIWVYTKISIEIPIENNKVNHVYNS